MSKSEVSMAKDIIEIPTDLVISVSQSIATADVEKDLAPPGPVSEINKQSMLIILSAFLISFVTIGFTNAFGVFQQYYIGLLHKDASAVSWIGSLNMFFLFGGSLFVGATINKTGPRTIVAIGSAFLLLGVFLASICTQYWQLILTEGLLIGIGDSLLFTPALICVTVAFQKRRGLALGMTVAGSSVGGIVWPIVLSRLLKEVGFGWTFRIAGFIMMPLCLISVLCVSMPGQAQKSLDGTPRPAPPKPDLGAILKNRRLLFFMLGGWFLYIGLFAGLVFIAVYSVSQGLSEQTAFYLVTITNAASLFGRVIPGALADIWGPYNLMIFAGISSGVIMACLTAAKSTAGIIIFAIAYGFTSGSVISLLGACVAPLLSSPSQYGPALGIMMAFLSTAALIGNPISGAILDRSGFLALTLASGSEMIFGAGVLLVLRFSQNKKLLAKV